VKMPGSMNLSEQIFLFGCPDRKLQVADYKKLRAIAVCHKISKSPPNSRSTGGQGGK